MIRRILLAIAVAGVFLGHLEKDLWGEEKTTRESRIGDRPVTMMLTGSAIRAKGIFRVYTIDSYVKQGLKIRTPQDMIDADQPKQMHLVMLRNVSGPDMADAFQNLIRSNHPEPEFNEEVKTVAAILRSQTAHKGDDIWFTHVPKVGFQCQSSGGMSHMVPNVAFSKAVWENYFGKNNASETVKTALLSKLPKE